jgi:hypothetical protein
MGFFFFCPNRRAIILKHHCMHCNYDIVEEWSFIKVIFDSNPLFHFCIGRNNKRKIYV